MAIAYGSGTTSTTATINKPAGTAVGDVLVAVVLAAHNADAAIAGFTARVSSDYAGSYRTTMLTRVVDGSEGASFTATGGTIYAVNMHRYSGVNTTTVIDGTPTSVAGASGVTTATPASITTTVNGAVLALSGGIVVSGGTSADGITWTAGMTERADAVGAAATIRAGMADETIATAGATGTRTATFTHTGGTPIVMAAMLALKASGGAPPASSGTDAVLTGLLLPL